MPAESDFARENRYRGNVCTVKGASSSMLDTNGTVNSTRVLNNGQFIGLSYGIEETDPWSELMSSMYFLQTRLFDCYINSTKGPMFNDYHGNKSRDSQCTDRGCYSVPYEKNRICVDKQQKDSAGRKFEPLSASLKGRPPLSTHVKMDVEGSEWGVLEQLLNSTEDLDRIRTLDMEVHMLYLSNDGTPLKRRVEIMEELARKFAVSGSTIQPLHQNVAREYQEKRLKVPDFVASPSGIYTSQGLPLEQYCVSFVNRQLLK